MTNVFWGITHGEIPQKTFVITGNSVDHTELCPCLKNYSSRCDIVDAAHNRGERNLHNQKQTNSLALSPLANYTDWATATCRVVSGVDAELHVSLTLALVAGDLSASHPSGITSKETEPYSIGKETGWALEPVWRRRRIENSWPYRHSNSDPICSLAHSQSLYRMRSSGPSPLI
jgi:hypothetical protein